MGASSCLSENRARSSYSNQKPAAVVTKLKLNLRLWSVPSNAGGRLSYVLVGSDGAESLACGPNPGRNHKEPSTIWSPGRTPRIPTKIPGEGLSMQGHINSCFFAFGLPPSFTPCPPSPSPATQSKVSRRLCTAPTPSSAKRASTAHARPHPQSWRRRRRGLLAASSSKSPKGGTCACVSRSRAMTRLCPCSASADPSRARSSSPSPKVSSLSPSACVSSRLSARSHPGISI